MLLLDFILILIIANVIPLIPRFVIFRRQLSKLASILIIIPVLFINIIFLAFIQDYTGGEGYVRGTSSLGPAAIISYFILRKENKPKTSSPKETILEGKTEGKKAKLITPKRVGIVLLILIAVIVVLVAYPFYSQNTNLPKTDKNPSNEEQVGDLYRNTKYGFRIIFPEGWEQKAGDGPNVLRKAGNGKSSINIGVRELSNILGDESFTIKDMMALSEFRDETIQQLKEKFSNVKLLDSGETKLGNVPAYWVKYKSSYSALGVTVNTTALQYQLLHNNILYFITAGTTEEEFNTTEPIFKKAIVTFVLEDY